MVARELLRELAETLLPQRCIVCRRFGAALHRDCLVALPAAGAARCDRCWAPGSRSPCAACSAAPPAWAVDAVVPVPLHRGRQRRRGFNQAELLARAVAVRLGLPLRTDPLRRSRATPAQARLGAEERARNVAGAFAASGDSPPALLLVDDVTTTGATLAAAAPARED